MKTLYIVRHAKSSWGFPDLKDEERPIIEKGIHNTNLMVKELVRREVMVDKMICSKARRTIETAKILARGLNYPIEKIESNKVLYTSDVDDLYEIIREIEDDIYNLMIIGHNPTLTQFVNRFLTEEIEILNTSAVLAFEFETKNWFDFEKSTCETKFMLSPKLLS